MSNYFIYNHGGSANHGCEALVRTVCNLLESENRLILYSEKIEEDFRYGVQQCAEIRSAVHRTSKLSWSFIRSYLLYKLNRNYFYLDVVDYQKSIEQFSKGMVEISVGGDIYCYDDYPKFMMLHRAIYNKGCKTVLLGCSLDEKLFQDSRFIEDMKLYDYISARESLTYELLRKVGIRNVGLTPDSAFTLPGEKLPLPLGFREGNTIGLNISPLILQKEKNSGMVMQNCERLIEYVLEKTDCAVALIPHVVWQDNDDRTVLQLLYNQFQSTGRVALIEDCNCMQLKGYISRCRFFIGARTHATIAAYSSLIPTLVLGYSIKSKGIAKDLFGTDQHYVLPVQSLEQPHELLDAFLWLWKHEEDIKQQLQNVIPSYIEEAGRIGFKVKEVLKN